MADYLLRASDNATVPLDMTSSCEEYHELNKTDWAPFVQNATACYIKFSFVEYIQVVLTSPKAIDSDVWFIGMNVLLTFWCIWLFLTLGVTTDSFFVPTLTKMSNQLKLSDNVAGVTLVAFGNGAADIFAALTAFTAEDPRVARLAIGSLFGAAMFVVMVVAGTCMLMEPIKPASRPLVRDVVCYVWCVYWLLQCLYKGKIELQDSVGFLIFYALYVIVVILGAKFGKKTVIDEDIKENGYEPQQPIKPLAINAMVLNRTRAMSNISTVERVNSMKRTQSTKKHVQSGLANEGFVNNEPIVNKNLALEGTRNRSNTNASQVSTQSQQPGTLQPFAKNRARAMSDLSVVEYGEKPEKIMPATQIKTSADYYREIYTPWDIEEFEGGGTVNKVLAYIIAPLYFCCKITCPVVGENEKNTWNRPLAIIQMFCLPWLFYIMLQQYAEEPFGTFPRWAIPLILSIAMSGVVFLTTYKLPLNEPPKYYFLFTIPGFLCTVLWIYVEANEVVGVLTSLGIFWKIDSVIMGLTFLAWANSVGDFVADVSLAKVGRARTAVAACYGTPLLNLLVGVGLGCTIGIAANPAKDAIYLDLTSLEASLIAGNCIMLVSILFILPLTGFVAGKNLGIYQIIFYFIALALCVLFGSGILSE